MARQLLRTKVVAEMAAVGQQLLSLVQLIQVEVVVVAVGCLQRLITAQQAAPALLSSSTP